MFQNKKIIGIIPARGGSKGVPRKNIKLAAGKPLLSYTIQAAKESRYLDHFVLSSDDDEILKVGSECGCEHVIKRPTNIATDSAPIFEAVLQVLEQNPGYDYLLLLQPTSPLRQAGDIDAIIEHCVGSGQSSSVSVCETSKNPQWMFFIQDNQFQPLVSQNLEQVGVKQRQELPKAYHLNGALYLAEVSWFLTHKGFFAKDTMPFVMPAERSLDIDTPLDFAYFEFLLQQQSTKA